MVETICRPADECAGRLLEHAPAGIPVLVRALLDANKGPLRKGCRTAAV